jgi:hypothetical protein
MGALSATWDKKYREPFMPLVPDIKHVAPDNLDKIREAITKKPPQSSWNPSAAKAESAFHQKVICKEVRNLRRKRMFC